MRRDDRPVLGPGGYRGGPDPLDDRERRERRARTVLVVLLLLSFIVITLDARRPDDSPVEPLRAVAGAVFGPLENGASTMMSPVTRVTDYFGDVEQLHATNNHLREENELLRSRLRTAGFAQQRHVELNRLLAVGRRRDDQVVPAQVTAMGGGQTFSRTVTIDAGRNDGVRPDMTVLNPQGLVGRVIEASSTSATVLLVIDPDSVVGGRLGSSMELGFIKGEGDIGEQGRLSMELVDRIANPGIGDSIVTWGSRNGAPYVAGVPIGSVEKVITSPRELSKTVMVKPYVDFSSLDMVGVVVDAHRPGDRTSADAGPGHARAGHARGGAQ